MNKRLALLFLFTSVLTFVSCTAAAPQNSVEPAADEEQATVEVIETVEVAPDINQVIDPGLTANPDALGMSVHTSKEAEAYFAQWPAEDKRRLNDDTVVIFTSPGPIADWVAGGIIYDIPSVSAVYLDFHGRIDEQLTHYANEEGQTRLEAILADTTLMQALQTEVSTRWESTLLEDAAYYADAQGISVEEAAARLQAQNAAAEPDLALQLETHEADTFAGLWWEHEPAFRLVVAFTENGEETIRPYIEGQSYAEYVEVRTHQYTLAELRAAQEEVMGIGPGFRAISIGEKNNRVFLEVDDPALFLEALQADGRQLPAPVELISSESGFKPNTLETITTPTGQLIYFPKRGSIGEDLEAELNGTLVLDENGCLRVIHNGDQAHLIVWRHGLSLQVTGEKIEVLNSKGQVVARVGETVSMGGSGVREGDIHRMSPDSLRTFFTETCPGSYWVQGGIDTLEVQAIPHISSRYVQVEDGRLRAIFLSQSKPAPEEDTLVGELSIDEQGCLQVGEYDIIWPPNIGPDDATQPLRFIIADGQTIATVGEEVRLLGAERTPADYRFAEQKLRWCDGPYWGVARIE